MKYPVVDCIDRLDVESEEGNRVGGNLVEDALIFAVPKEALHGSQSKFYKST